MKLPESQIEMAAGVKDVRYYLNGVYVDCEDNRLVATNGCILAAHPYTPENGEVSGIIPLDVVKAARIGGVKASMMVERVTHDSDGSEHAQAINGRSGASVQMPMIDGKFPDYKKVLPNKPAGPPTVTINADLLADLQKALTTREGISLWITGPNDSIYVEGVDQTETGACGVLMPRGR